MANATRGGDRRAPSRRLHEAHRCRRDFRLAPELGEADRLERRLLAEPHGGGAHHRAAGVAVVDDLPVLDFDPRAEPVREAEAVGGAQALEVFDHVGRRVVVVRDADLEGQLGHARHRLRRDPRDRRDRRLDAHQHTSLPLAPKVITAGHGPRPRGARRGVAPSSWAPRSSPSTSTRPRAGSASAHSRSHSCLPGPNPRSSRPRSPRRCARCRHRVRRRHRSERRNVSGGAADRRARRAAAVRPPGSAVRATALPLGVVAAAAAWNGRVGRPAGALLVALYIAYVAAIWIRERRPPALGEVAELADADPGSRPRPRRSRELGLVLAGVAALAIGSIVLVEAMRSISGSNRRRPT